MYWPERYRTQLLVCSATKSGLVTASQRSVYRNGPSRCARDPEPSAQRKLVIPEFIPHPKQKEVCMFLFYFIFFSGTAFIPCVTGRGPAGDAVIPEELEAPSTEG